MYENSNKVFYTNVSTHPCRIECSRWSLNTPINSNKLSDEPVTKLSSSLYFPSSRQTEQVFASNYANYYPSSPSSSSHISNYDHPKSNLRNSTTINHPTYHVNDLRQRYESKAIVGIVKPIVHQRSYTLLNSKNDETKVSYASIGKAYHRNSILSLYSPPIPTSTSTSPVIYQTPPIQSHNNTNGPPPIAPKRYSSINTNKRTSSRRSSRTTSTSSSIAVINELSSRISLHENEQQYNDKTITVDVKRLEMFYGSAGTLVKAARSIARLYITTTRQLANFEDWSCQQLGVPIWIYNTGANLKRARQVQLMLAQHESCFSIWSSSISDQAEIRLPKENHITCWLPESNVLAIFKFEHNEACRLFFRHYYEILEYERRMNLANPPPLPADDSSSRQQQQQQLNTTNNKVIPSRYSRLRTTSNKQDKEQEQQQFELRRCRSLSKIRTVKKSDISRPVNFEHVNHVSTDCKQQKQRPLSGSVTLRSLHASMSYLPNTGKITERLFNQNKRRNSTSFETRATTV